MKDTDLAKMQARLVWEKRELQATLRSFVERGSKSAMNETSGELSAYDQHPADYGSQLFEREKDMGLMENLEGQLKQVEHALAAVESGTYGLCERCGQAIPTKRLQTIPYTTLCVDCKEKEEQSEAT